MSILNIINQLAATDKTSLKEKILKESASNETLKECFYLAYCKQVTFGVKKYDKPSRYSSVLSLSGALQVFKNKLATRQVTGNAALQLVTDTLTCLSEDDAKVAMMVLNRDLECGCSATTANKVWKKLIPQQPCHLASSCSDKTIANIKYPAYAQLKSDGARGMADIDGETLAIYTRSGNTYQGLDDLFAVLERLRGRGIVLDGELVYMPTLSQTPAQNFIEGVYDGTLSWIFEEEEMPLTPVAEAVKESVVADRQTGNGILNKSLKGTIPKEEAQCIVYTVWDVIDRDVYYGNEKATKQYKDRFEELKQIVEELNDPRVQIIENTVVNNIDEAREVYHRYVNMGLEGIILKNLHGVFEDRRSKDQVKFKEVIDFDAEIVDVYPHSKDPNKVGGFTVRSACGRMTTNTGSGLTDTTTEKGDDGIERVIPFDRRNELDREMLWADRHNLIGKVIEMTCNGYIRSKSRKDDEPEFSLFLPIIKRIRYDKTTANTVKEVFDV